MNNVVCAAARFTQILLSQSDFIAVGCQASKQNCIFTPNAIQQKFSTPGTFIMVYQHYVDRISSIFPEDCLKESVRLEVLQLGDETDSCDNVIESQYIFHEAAADVLKLLFEIRSFATSVTFPLT